MAIDRSAFSLFVSYDKEKVMKPMNDVNGLSFWLLFVVLLPLGLGVIGALPVWLKRRAVLGNVVGSVIIAAVIFVLIWQQYGAFVQAQAVCSQALSGCAADGTSLYGPYLFMVLLGWVDVFFLLIFSGIVEDHYRHRWPDRSQL